MLIIFSLFMGCWLFGAETDNTPQNFTAVSNRIDTLLRESIIERYHTSRELRATFLCAPSRFLRICLDSKGNTVFFICPLCRHELRDTCSHNLAKAARHHLTNVHPAVFYMRLGRARNYEEQNPPFQFHSTSIHEGFTIYYGRCRLEKNIYKTQCPHCARTYIGRLESLAKQWIGSHILQCQTPLPFERQNHE